MVSSAHFLVFFYVYYQALVMFVHGIGAPSFVSNWVNMKAQDAGLSYTVITHNLNEYPVKVDVQVKVEEDGEDYIFTGIGSAHRDDDEDGYYGGVIYAYNTVEVKLYVPKSSVLHSATSKGLCAYTGHSEGKFTGPSGITGKYTDVEVRVRAWKLCDFGAPSFVSQWDISMDDSSNTYKSVTHGLGKYPDAVSVQVKMADGYISDAQGNAFVASYYSTYQAIGGIVYGYDETTIRLWAPKQSGSQTFNGAVFTIIDGWGNSVSWEADSGDIRIIMWNFPSDEIVFTQTLSPFGIGVASSYEVAFPSQYSINNYLVTVEVSADGGNNEDYRFQGAGSCMGEGSDQLGVFGGVVYVYNKHKVMLYRPADTSIGKLVYIGGRWGNGASSQSSTTGTVIVKVFTAAAGYGACGQGTCTPNMASLTVSCDCSGTALSGTYCKTVAACPTPSSVNNALLQYSALTDGGTVLYSCQSGFYLSSGNQERTCSSGAWTGTLPVCTVLECADPGDIGHATKNLVSRNVGGTVTYDCDSGYTVSSGSRTRTCEVGGQWSGTPPICSAIQCTEAVAVAGASMIAEGRNAGDTVTYSCLDGYSKTSGFLVLTCTTSGTWDKAAPTCTAGIAQCPDPGEIANAVKTLGGTNPTDTVTYTCNSGFEKTSGDLVRTCLFDQTWDGNAPVCSAILCPIPNVIAGANMLAVGTYAGDTVNYTCQTGYTHTSGATTITCLNTGSWDSAGPVCTASTQCPDPGEVANADKTLGGTDPTDTVTYTCKSGFEKTSGDLVRTCLNDQTWNGNAPVCSAIQCPTPSVIPGANMLAVGTYVDDTVNYTCQTGYSHTSGATIITCLNTGSWDSAGPVCTANTVCPDPGEVANAVRTLGGTSPTDTVSYTCESGYQKSSGDLVRTCLNDQTWDGNAPFCSAIQCPTPAVLTGANMIAAGTYIGDTVRYACQTGYIHTAGITTITCLNTGSWDSAGPVCTLVTCEDPDVADNSAVTVSSKNHGGTATYTCDAGFFFNSGDSIRYCYSSGDVIGNWTGDAPICAEFIVVSTSNGLENSTLEQRITKLKKELEVPKKNTSLYRRSLISVHDDRPSSLYIGTIGIVLLCVTFGFLILADTMNLVKMLKKYK